MASEAAKIVIVLEGGLVQGVLTAGVPVSFVVVDYDTEGADPAEVAAIPQWQSMDVAEALLCKAEAEPIGPWVLNIHDIADARRG